uniref:NADPH-dependent oxidoreductase n=1 Tax=Ignisphaera aggregans TaxID=334771 RepID=A0A7C2ZPW9_9CREN
MYERVISSDGIIFVTPIYWYNVPGPLKNFIDRLTLLENAIFTEGRSKAEGKVTGFVVIGNDTGAIAVIQNLMAVLNSFGTIIPPWALAYHTLESHPIENDKFLLDLANVVRCVILMVRLVKEGIKIDYWYRADEEYKNLVKSLAGKVLAEIQKTIL